MYSKNIHLKFKKYENKKQSNLEMLKFKNQISTRIYQKDIYYINDITLTSCWKLFSCFLNSLFLMTNTLFLALSISFPACYLSPSFFKPTINPLTPPALFSTLLRRSARISQPRESVRLNIELIFKKSCIHHKNKKLNADKIKDRNIKSNKSIHKIINIINK